jgi:predicted HicB family RNase H-like nuclease
MALKAKPLGTVKSRNKLESALEEVSKEPTDRLNVNVPHSVYKQLKMKALEHETTVSELVNLWINKYISK